MVIGAGGHALVVVEVLQSLGRQVIGCVSDDGTASAKLPVDVVGRSDQVVQIADTHRAAAFIAIGDNRARQRIQAQLASAGIELPAAISPQAIVSATARISAGTLVMPGAVINAQARIGDGVIINTGAVVEHECAVGDFAHLCPNSALAGRVIVGEGAFVGIGAAAIPGVTIGSWAIVGAGAAVIDDVDEGATVGGVPARRLR